MYLSFFQTRIVVSKGLDYVLELIPTHISQNYIKQQNFTFEGDFLQLSSSLNLSHDQGGGRVGDNNFPILGDFPFISMHGTLFLRHTHVHNN